MSLAPKKFPIQVPPFHADTLQKLCNRLNLLIPFLMGIYVFANPLPFPALSIICLYSALLCLAVLFAFRKATFSLNSPLALPLGLFSLWATLGLFYTLDFNNTLHDLRVYLFSYLAVLFLLVNYFNTKSRLETLSVVIIFSVTVASIWTVITYYFIDGYPLLSRLGDWGDRSRFKDMPGINIGFITLPALALALHKVRGSSTTSKIWLFSAIFILLATTVSTQSRATLMGLLAILIIFSMRQKIYLLVLLALLLVIPFIPGLADRLTAHAIAHDGRNKTSYLAIEVIKMRPLAGFGFGMSIYGNSNLIDLQQINAQAPVEFRQEKIIEYPHNTFLDITARTGIIGLLLFLNILLAAFMLLKTSYYRAKSPYLKSWTICLAACLVSYLIPAFFTDTNIGARAAMFFIILAMVVVVWNLALHEPELEEKPYTCTAEKGT